MNIKHNLIAKALREKAAEIDQRPNVHDADLMWFADEYADAVLAMLKSVEWQPIETAPLDGTRVLIFVPGEMTFESDGEEYPNTCAGVHAAYYSLEGNRQIGRRAINPLTKKWETPYANGVWTMGEDPWSDDSYTFHYLDAQPTHWMPLPEPPK